MFDPTAFDNMKVVLEGAIYDRDLLGDILVVKRDDLINLATLSRLFTIEFELKDSRYQKKVYGGMNLNASLKNLSSEILNTDMDEKWIGSTVQIYIFIREELKVEIAGKIIRELEEIWGQNRLIEWKKESISTNSNQQFFSSNFTITFDRLIREDQMDDLVEMIEYLIQSLQAIEVILKEYFP